MPWPWPGVVAAGLLFSTHRLDGAPHDAAGQQGAGDGGLRLRQPDAWLKATGFREVSADGYPLVNVYIAIENGHLSWIYLLNMVIFQSYVSLPEGIIMSTLD